ncbi:MAG: hypothetical protein EBT03_11835, partial [Betaproteobacteria bacterium]|nr:hypothetical protein [Betaproteobacteria bacterium]
MPKTTNKTDSKADVKHSIPMAGERKSSVIDRLRKKVKPNTRSVKDSERAVIELDRDTQAKFINYACSKELFDLVEAQKSQQQKEVSSEIYERFVDALWRSKSQPQNPAIKAETSSGRVDAEGTFIVSGGSKIKVNMPETRDDESPEDALIRGLVDVGVSLSNAERLVTSEVSFVPQWSLNFTDMMRGEVKGGKIAPPTPTQMTAAEILLCVINGEDLEGNELDSKKRSEMLKGITDDGWFAIKANVEGRTTYFPTLVDSADFLDRIC